MQTAYEPNYSQKPRGENFLDAALRGAHTLVTFVGKPGFLSISDSTTVPSPACLFIASATRALSRVAKRSTRFPPR